MKSCCSNFSKKDKICFRSDTKVFNLPRKFTRKQCQNIKGFSMRSSCAPFQFCNKESKYLGGKTYKKREKKQFLYNPNNPKKSFDVYIDKNPKDTINIKYKTLEDVQNTIKHLEKLYKNNKYSHKRIWQVGMIMYVRLKVLKNKKPEEYNLAKKYFKFLGKRTKIKNDLERKKFNFK
mgnify:FL=1|tara:strand:- start:3332 stop:3862 length:531 start_codon:yes stop_codon:yes gene_type:complete